MARTLGGSEKNRVVEAPGARAAARCRRRGSTRRVRGPQTIHVQPARQLTWKSKSSERGCPASPVDTKASAETSEATDPVLVI